MRYSMTPLLDPSLAWLCSEYERAMRGKNSTFVVYERKLSSRNLTRALIAPQLPHRFDDPHQSANRACVGMGKHSTVGVDGQLAVEGGVACRKKRAALASLAKAELFQLDDRHDGKAVVELRYVDVLRRDARRAECGTARFHGAEPGQALRAHQVLVRMRL